MDGGGGGGFIVDDAPNGGGGGGLLDCLEVELGGGGGGGFIDCSDVDFGGGGGGDDMEFCRGFTVDDLGREDELSLWRDASRKVLELFPV